MSKRETADAVKGILGEQQDRDAEGSGDGPSESPSQGAGAADATPGVSRGAQRQVTAYLAPEDANRLAEIAEARDRSLAYIVREAVRDYLDREA